MLQFIMGLPSCVETQVITDQRKIQMLLGNLKIISSARSEDYCRRLVFYARRNVVGRYERGIVYAPGPGCANSSSFGKEMRRFFSHDLHSSFNIAQQYYIDLVVEEAMLMVK
jgi:hypothetical protein